MKLAKFRSIGLDVLTFVGFLVLAYGFWLAWKPLGYILGGLCLAAIAGLTNYREGRRSPRTDGWGN